METTGSPPHVTIPSVGGTPEAGRLSGAQAHEWRPLVEHADLSWVCELVERDPVIVYS